MTEDLTPDEVSTALLAIQGGDQEALSAFYTRYAPVLSRMTYRLAGGHLDEEVLSIGNAAFMEEVYSVSPHAEQADTLLYVAIRGRMQAEMTMRSTVYAPIGTVRRYWTIRNKYDTEAGTVLNGRQSRSYEQCFRDAYEACRRREERMEADVFLAVHRALYSNEDRLSLGTVDGDGVRDEYSGASNVVDVGSVDAIDTVDTYTLVHRHLLPLLDPKQHEDTIVKLGYGITQLSPAVIDKLAEAGFQPGAVLSDVEMTEVLRIDGMGARTVGRRRRAALAKMRAYLEHDETLETT